MTFNDALAQLRQCLDAGLMSEAFATVREALRSPYSLMQLQKLNALVKNHESAFLKHFEGRVLRVAVLGTYTTQPICEAVTAMVLTEGHFPIIYEAAYDSLEAETLDPGSSLYAFKPDIVLLATGAQSLKLMPEPGAGEDRVQALADRVLATMEARWQAIAANSNARIIQHNFDQPAFLPAARLEGRYAWSASRFVQRLNDQLWKHDGRGVRIMDVHQLSCDQGRLQWFDPRWFHHSKHGFAFTLLRSYALAFSGLLRGLLGHTAKCLVLDLDNTLWGGVIGDDGVDGIHLGNSSAAGEAFAAFGHYLKSLQGMGVLLAINSKNNPEVAMEVFDKHPESPLRRSDFAAIKCNWLPKSDNLRAIAQQLNIGLDSLVFADDNPAECAEVRAALPEVTVIEMQGDPAYFPRRIEELQLFAPLDFTEEDAMRSQSYAARQALVSASATPTSLDAHLRSLDMEGVARLAAAGDLSRIEQLFRKTNQFNLTGRTYEQSALEQAAQGGNHIVLAAWLRDAHANHGLVSTLVASIEGDVLCIDNWVMSCRVFTRTFEEFILARLQELASERRCALMRVRFTATAKNTYARAALDRLGFERASESDGKEVLERTIAGQCPPTLIRSASDLRP